MILKLLTPFIATLCSCLLIIKYKDMHDHLSGDSDLRGPQKIHENSVPRIGGLGILIGILASALYTFTQNQVSIVLYGLMLSGFPAFFIGLTEDVTKSISIRRRLVFTIASAIVAFQFYGVKITNIDIFGIDFLLKMEGVSLIFTIFCICGLVNAYNFIDGLNGLSSMIGIFTLTGLGYVANIYDDQIIRDSCTILTICIFGFFICNFPKGKIFLGDGGAYIIGFLVATLSILLVSRHSEISPWFAILINIYPITETMHSILRRRFHKQSSPILPDDLHMHSLIYKLLLKRLNGAATKREYVNSFSSIPLWVLGSLSVLAGMMFNQSRWLCLICSLVFIGCYTALYKLLNYLTELQ